MLPDMSEKGRGQNDSEHGVQREGTVMIDTFLWLRSVCLQNRRRLVDAIVDHQHRCSLAKHGMESEPSPDRDKGEEEGGLAESEQGPVQTAPPAIEVPIFGPDVATEPIDERELIDLIAGAGGAAAFGVAATGRKVVTGIDRRRRRRSKTELGIGANISAHSHTRGGNINGTRKFGCGCCSSNAHARIENAVRPQRKGVQSRSALEEGFGNSGRGGRGNGTNGNGTRRVVQSASASASSTIQQLATGIAGSLVSHVDAAVGVMMRVGAGE
jgi:hypothetical protein